MTMNLFPAISSSLIRTLAILCIPCVLPDGLLVLRVVFWFILNQIVPYGRACHLCVPEGLCMVSPGDHADVMGSKGRICWCESSDSLRNTGFLQGSLYPFPRHSYLREVTVTATVRCDEFNFPLLSLR